MASDDGRRKRKGPTYSIPAPNRGRMDRYSEDRDWLDKIPKTPEATHREQVERARTHQENRRQILNQRAKSPENKGTPAARAKVFSRPTRGSGGKSSSPIFHSLSSVAKARMQRKYR